MTILLDVVISTIHEEQVSIPCVAIISRFKARTYRFTVDHVVVNVKKISISSLFVTNDSNITNERVMFTRRFKENPSS